MGLKVGIRRVTVRYDPASDLWTMRCDDCARSSETTAYWPLGLECWDPAQGLQRCRACHRAARRSRKVHELEFIRARQRRYYRNSRDKVLAYQKRHYAENRERIREQRRANYAKRKAEAA